MCGELEFESRKRYGLFDCSPKGNCTDPLDKLQAFDRLILTMPDKDIWSQYIVFTMGFALNFCFSYKFINKPYQKEIHDIFKC